MQRESFILGSFLGGAVTSFLHQEYRLGIAAILSGIMFFLLTTSMPPI